MHPATIYLDLRDRGFALSLRDGKLFCTPIKTLPEADRDLLVAHRAALVEWLAAADDDNARADAVAARAAADNPFLGGSDRPSVLVRLHDEGESPAYEAFDPEELRVLDEWCAAVRKDAAGRDERRREREKAKRKLNKVRKDELDWGDET